MFECLTFDRYDDCVRQQVQAWRIVSRRLGLIKDVSCLIGQLIWKSR